MTSAKMFGAALLAPALVLAGLVAVGAAAAKMRRQT